MSSTSGSAGGKRSLRRAAWAGLQDSMPRAALLSIHARVEGATHAAWDDPSLVQVWGPRYQVYVVAAPDLAALHATRGCPTPARPAPSPRSWPTASQRCSPASGCATATPGTALGGTGNSLRYATLTGRLAIRWEGARAPARLDRPAADDQQCRRRARELARRYLHIYGPSTAAAFAKWAGIGAQGSRRRRSTSSDRADADATPLGDAHLLAADEDAIREPPAPAAPARLLPSGDSYWLHTTAHERALLVPDEKQRDELWTPRVWPGALLVDGEIVGTWRRAKRVLTIETWKKLSAAARDAVVAEADTLPLPDPGEGMTVHWN